MTEAFGWSRVLVRPTGWASFCGFLGLVLLALLTVADVLLRWLFNLPIDGVDDLTQLTLAVVIASCLPAGLLQGHNITIRFLGMACGRRTTYWLEAFGGLLTLVFYGLMSWQITVLAGEQYNTGNTTIMVMMQTAPFWAVVSIFLALCVLVQAVVLIGHILRAFRGGGAGGIVESDALAIADDAITENKNTRS